jgi:hypothetical protein
MRAVETTAPQIFAHSQVRVFVAAKLTGIVEAEARPCVSAASPASARHVASTRASFLAAFEWITVLRLDRGSDFAAQRDGVDWGTLAETLQNGHLRR